MNERHVTFHVHPGAEPAFEETFAIHYRPAMSRQPGFATVELLRALDHPGTYRMVIRFESAQHAADWRESSEHAALKPVLRPFYSASEVEVFDVLSAEVPFGSHRGQGPAIAQAVNAANLPPSAPGHRPDAAGQPAHSLTQPTNR